MDAEEMCGRKWLEKKRDTEPQGPYIDTRVLREKKQTRLHLFTKLWSRLSLSQRVEQRQFSQIYQNLA